MRNHFRKTFNFMFLILLMGVFFTSCSDNKQSKQEFKNASGKNDSTSDKSKEVDYTAISTDICDCVTDAENSLGASFKNLIINASKADHPETAIQTEMLRITDSSDQQKLMEEFKSYKNFHIESCMKSIEKKYPGLNRPTKEQQKKLLDAMEENCSEFSAAVMRMGFRNGE